MPQKDYLIIYHKEDNDGVFSAAIIYDYIINVLKIKLEDLVFIGADYSMMKDFSNDEKNAPEQLHQEFKHIILTDISFEPKYMKALYDEFKNDIIWIDHHLPIIKDSFRNKFDEIPGVRDISRSAILCAYKYLYDPFDEAYNNKKIPKLFRILSGWDSWSYEKEGFNIDYVRNVNKAVTIKYELSLSKVKSLVNDLINIYVNNKDLGINSIIHRNELFIKELYEYGKMLNDYDDIVMKDIIKTSGDFNWTVCGSRKACAIFHQGSSNSIMFKSVKDKIDCGIIFKHNSNGLWTISLYNANDDYDFHCGEYLKSKYNGGGHKGAAGCQVTEKQFIKMLKEKNI